MLAKITKRTVDALKPGSKDLFLWDTELKGFGLKVTPGGNKVYVLQYRKGGRVRAEGAHASNRWHPTKRVTIGRHGSLTPEQAREKARELSGAVTSGGDPAALVAAEKSAPTVAALAHHPKRARHRLMGEIPQVSWPAEPSPGGFPVDPNSMTTAKGPTMSLQRTTNEIGDIFHQRG